jgi:hypothetical protein
MRRAELDPSRPAPYFSASVRSGSQRSRKGNENFSAKARFSSTVSKLAPRMTAFLDSNSWIRSRNPLPSSVQPGVSALG